MEKTTPVQLDTNSKQAGAEEQVLQDGGVSRRGFLLGAALLGAGAVSGGAAVSAFAEGEDVVAWKQSNGYLLVDTKKCAGCRTCMFTCSLVHHGVTSLSLARIQIRSNAFGTFPLDIAQTQCHQCPYPPCVDACPTEANHIDEETGVRMVDPDKCIGCERCVEACPYSPSRLQWNRFELHAQKCDLCIDTPYWSREGGPQGTQACVASCPMQAISFTSDIPRQGSEGGYVVNLRNEHYLSLGLPNDDDGKIIPSTTY